MVEVDSALDFEKQAHPFVNAAKMGSFIGSPVALLGKVDKVEANQFIVKSTDEEEVRVVKFKQGENLPRQLLAG